MDRNYSVAFKDYKSIDRKEENFYLPYFSEIMTKKSSKTCTQNNCQGNVIMQCDQVKLSTPFFFSNLLKEFKARAHCQGPFDQASTTFWSPLGWMENITIQSHVYNSACNKRVGSFWSHQFPWHQQWSVASPFCLNKGEMHKLYSPSLIAHGLNGERVPTNPISNNAFRPYFHSLQHSSTGQYLPNFHNSEASRLFSKERCQKYRKSSKLINTKYVLQSLQTIFQDIDMKLVKGHPSLKKETALKYDVGDTQSVLTFRSLLGLEVVQSYISNAKEDLDISKNKKN